MHHPLVVGIGHRVAGGDEVLEQLAEPQAPPAVIAAGRSLAVEGVDGLLEGAALDEGHGVERAGLVLAQAVDRHDAGVLEPGGQHGLAEEPPPRRVVEAGRAGSV